MNDLWVSWMKPIGRARIHRGSCSNCNDGQGQAGQRKDKREVTGWHGPFDLSAAEAKATSLSRAGYQDVEFCGTCLRTHRPLGLSNT